jgi:hypothetical protein
VIRGDDGKACSVFPVGFSRRTWARLVFADDRPPQAIFGALPERMTQESNKSPTRRLQVLDGFRGVGALHARVFPDLMLRC